MSTLRCIRRLPFQLDKGGPHVQSICRWFCVRLSFASSSCRWSFSPNADAQEYQADITDATPVQLGVLTPKQRIHSRLQNSAGMRVGRKTISEWLAFSVIRCLLRFQRIKKFAATKRVGIFKPFEAFLTSRVLQQRRKSTAQQSPAVCEETNYVYLR